MFFLDNIIFLKGTLTKKISLTMLGYSKLLLILLTFFSAMQYIASALPKYISTTALLTLHIVSGS